MGVDLSADQWKRQDSVKGAGSEGREPPGGRSQRVYVRADGLYLHFTEIELFGNSCVREGLINHGFIFLKKA